MARPLTNEAEIFARINNEKIRVHPVVWDLLDHYIGNDIQSVQFIAGSYVSGDKPEAIPADAGTRILNHCDEIRKFLRKLKDATRKEV